MKVTLKKIWSNRPCELSWNTLVDGLGMSGLKELNKDEKAPNIEVSLRFILENNGWEDCKWAWKCVGGYEREFRLLAVAFAKPFKHLMKDPRSLHALKVSERFANGLATVEELIVATDAAYYAYETADADADAADADAADAADAAHVAYVASRSFRSAARVSYASSYYLRAAQIAEFKRLLDCVEAGETYNI